MVKGTFWLEPKPNGDITIGIEDYDVEFFDGGDHEMMWTLGPENTTKLTDILSHLLYKKSAFFFRVFYIPPLYTNVATSYCCYL